MAPIAISYCYMKTTVVIDQAKLKRVMKLTGIKTRRSALDFALDQAERIARLNSVYEDEFYCAKPGEVIDPNYSLEKLRKRDKRGSVQ